MTEGCTVEEDKGRWDETREAWAPAGFHLLLAPPRSSNPLPLPLPPPGQTVGHLCTGPSAPLDTRHAHVLECSGSWTWGVEAKSWEASVSAS